MFEIVTRMLARVTQRWLTRSIMWFSILIEPCQYLSAFFTLSDFCTRRTTAVVESYGLWILNLYYFDGIKVHILVKLLNYHGFLFVLRSLSLSLMFRCVVITYSKQNSQVITYLIFSSFFLINKRNKKVEIHFQLVYKSPASE